MRTSLLHLPLLLHLLLSGCHRLWPLEPVEQQPDLSRRDAPIDVRSPRPELPADLGDARARPDLLDLGVDVRPDLGNFEDGLVAYYPFEGDARDTFGGYDAAPANVLCPVVYDNTSFKAGSASAHFDGSCAHLELGYRQADGAALKDALAEDFTVAFWVETSQYIEYDSQAIGVLYYSNDCTQKPLWLVGRGIVDAETCGTTTPDWGIALMVGGYLGVKDRCSDTSIWPPGVVDGGLGTADAAPGQPTWHQVVMTRRYAGGMCTLYVDGKQEVETPCAGSYANVSYIGVGNSPCNADANWRWFEGHVDELRFWSRVLSPTEIPAVP